MEKFCVFCERSISYSARLKSLHQDHSNLLTKIKIFVYDLTWFSNDPEARARLERGDQYCMSEIYFSADDRDFIMKFPTPTGLSFAQHIDLTMRDKAKSGKNEICTSHDLVPMITKVFGIQKGFQDERKFKDALKVFEKSSKVKN